MSGVPPPEHTRWQPGQSGNPGGRPRGSDVRAVLLRELAQGWEDDPEPDPELKSGKKAREIARALVESGLVGNRDVVMSLAEVINQAQGKPQEFVAHSGDVTARTVIVNKTTGAPPALPEIGDAK